MCRLVDEELTVTQRICEAVGHDVSSGLWASAVGLSDAMTAYLDEHMRVNLAAKEAGYTREQWTGIQGRVRRPG